MTLIARKALVVDDETEVRELTCRALSQTGFTCDQAPNGELGYRMACTKKYDAIVTDLRMPQKHGHALCNDLLKMDEPPPLLVLTALSDARLVHDLMTRGVYDVIQKPVPYDVLAMKVLSMVENPRQKTVPAKPTDEKSRSASKVNLLQQIEASLFELTGLFGDRLDSVFDWHEELASPPKAIRDFIRRLAESELHGNAENAQLPGHETRTTDRVTCYTTATAVPVDSKWRPTCQPFRLAMRDLSESGARMVHTRATNAQYLALKWNATQHMSRQLRVVLKVMRVKPLSPFYDIGGQFVMAD